jgi:hypothetical protein
MRDVGINEDHLFGVMASIAASGKSAACDGCETLSSVRKLRVSYTSEERFGTCQPYKDQ